MKSLIAIEAPSIVLISETWLHKGIDSSELELPQYVVGARKDRLDTHNGRGGGVVILVRKDLNFCPVNVDEPGTCGIKVGNTSVYCTYLSPNADQASRVKLNSFLVSCGSDSAIFGDFNYPSIDWTTFQGGSNDEQAFLDALANGFLNQHVEEPTHIAGNTLDLLLTTCPDMVSFVKSREDLIISDHYPLECQFLTAVTFTISGELVPVYSKGSYDDFKSFLDEISWIDVLLPMSTTDAWNFFCKQIKVGMSLFVPWRLRREKNNPLWLKDDLVRKIRKKRRLWLKYKDTRNESDLKKFKCYRSQVQNWIRGAKITFEESLARKKNVRSLHAYVRDVRRGGKTINALVDDQGILQDDVSDVVNILNDHFSSVFSGRDQSSSNFPYQKTGAGFTTILSNIVFHSSDVLEKLKQLKTSSAPGPDNISAFTLKRLASSLAGPLALLFNKSFGSGHLPDDWLSGNVTPLHKSGDVTRASNYRPVSLTSVCCKVMERIVKDKMTKFMNDHNLFSSEQHGFRAGLSCTTSGLLFHDYLTHSLENKLPLDVIFMDFSKAFDKVSHSLLILKLRRAGVGGALLNWIRSWLMCRKQRVVLNGRSSRWVEVTSGVPQGSVLGPLLFLVFINDLKPKHGSLDIKFADDVKLFRQVPSVWDCQELQADIDSVCDWATRNGMHFNSGKCVAWGVGRKSYGVDFDYKIGGNSLSRQSRHVDLGVSFDSRLTFSGHCASLILKSNKVLGMIRRHFLSRDPKIFMGLFKTYVRPLLEFSSQIWNPINRGDAKIIEKVQRRATKLVKNLWDLPYENRLSILSLQSLEERRERLDLIFTFKMRSGHVPITPLGDAPPFFVLAESTQMKTRWKASQPLFEPLAKTRLRHHSFFVRMTRIWNKLPPTVRSADKTSAFKRLLANQ